jgi:outer membrane receptor for ferrienterochelin and colicin
MIISLLRLTIITTILIISTNVSMAQTGIISGVITDQKTRESIVGANVIIEGTLTGASSNLDGEFEIRGLQPGVYNLVVSFISYKEKLITGVTVKSGETTSLKVQLEEEISMIEGVQVVSRRRTDTEVSMLSTIKQSEIVISGISAQQISRSQDSDASMVIKRIPGVTVVDDRFIMIRGLSERYNPTMLHNVFAPSMEADVKSFSFDIIPSPLIDQILIYKSPSAELPGEFAGGVVKIFTRNIPDNNSINISYSGSYVSGSTFRDFYSQKQGSTQWLGFNDGINDLPNGFPTNLRSIADKPQELTAAGRSLQNNWVPLKRNSGVNHNLLVTGTLRFNIGKVNIGNITSISYNNARSIDDVLRQDFNLYDPELNISSLIYRFNDQQNNHRIRTGLLHNWAFSLGSGHTVEFKNLFNQISSSQYVYRTGPHKEFGYIADNHSFYNLYRGIYAGQLSGNHNLFGKTTTLEWVAGYGSSYRDEPDYRRYRSDLDTSNGTLTLYVPFGAAAAYFLGRYYSEMKEDNYSASLKVKQKISLPSLLIYDPVVSLGAFFEDKDREFISRNMGYVRSSTFQFDQDLLNVSIDSLFHPDNINSTYGIRIDEQSNPSDSYTAHNTLNAFFVQLDFPVNEKLRFVGGVRVEDHTQKFNSFTLTNDPIIVNNPVLSVLPSFYAGYNFSDKTLIRFAYGQTVNRPEFRELAPFGFYDFNFNLVKKGNENLLSATIHNFDLRWERYPTPSEIIMVGVFYKRFFDPIETSFIPGGGTGGIKTFTYRNADQATSLGIEAEVRKSLSGVTNSSFLEKLTVLFNGALIKSNVELGQAGLGQSNTERPMQGQSPFIVNAGLYYSDSDKKLQVNLLYNVVGKRIFLIGYDDYPDIYEMPRNQLDLTITKGFGNNLEFKAGIRDILNQEHLLLQDANQDGKFDRKKDQTIQRYIPGRVFSAGFNLKI